MIWSIRFIFSAENENGIFGLFSGESRCCAISLSPFTMQLPQTMHHSDVVMKCESVDKPVCDMLVVAIVSKLSVAEGKPLDNSASGQSKLTDVIMSIDVAAE
jgi:hypothetical protein